MTDTQILSEKIVFQSKFFHIKQVTIQRNGKTFVKDIIERDPVALILPITENNEVYLVSQHRDAFQHVLLECVAGLMKQGENPLGAAKRELQEETGLQAKQWKQITTWELSSNMQQKTYLFLARELTEGKSENDEDENISVVKMPLQEAITKAIHGEIAVATHVGALLMLEKLLQEKKL